MSIHFSNAENFSRLAERRFAVCRVVLENGQGGTGFLIGRNLILTNNHVLPNKEIADKAKAVFFYTTGSQGTEVKFDPGNFFYTSPTANRLKPTTAEKLDFTIVSIQSHPKIAEINHLAFCILDSPKPKKENYATIIHHPILEDKTSYQKVSPHNNVIKETTLFAVHYTTPTMPGSSGAPVMNDEGNLIALHRAACGEISSAFLKEKVLKALLQELFPNVIFTNKEFEYEEFGISKKCPAQCAIIDGTSFYIFSKGELKGKYYHEKKMKSPNSFLQLIEKKISCPSVMEWALQFLKQQGVDISDYHKECNTAVPIHAICIHLQKTDHLDFIKARYEASQKTLLTHFVEYDPFSENQSVKNFLNNCMQKKEEHVGISSKTPLCLNQKAVEGRDFSPLTYTQILANTIGSTNGFYILKKCENQSCQTYEKKDKWSFYGEEPTISMRHICKQLECKQCEIIKVALRGGNWNMVLEKSPQFNGEKVSKDFFTQEGYADEITIAPGLKYSYFIFRRK